MQIQMQTQIKKSIKYCHLAPTLLVSPTCPPSLCSLHILATHLLNSTSKYECECIARAQVKPPNQKKLEIKSTSDTQSSILASLIPFPLTHSRWPACHQISFQRQKNDFSKVDREWTIKIAAGQVGSKCSRHLWNSLATHRAQTVIRGNAAIFNSAASNNCSVTLSILKLQKLKPRFEDILTLRNSTWLQL